MSFNVSILINNKRKGNSFLFCALFIMINKVISLLFLITVVLSACKKSELPLPYLDVADYYNLQVGSVLIYRMDSTAATAFGTALITNSYHVKDSVINTFLDNEGRVSYRVFRYLNDTAEAKTWQYLFSYYVTPVYDGIELVDDNNLRFIKIKSPARDGFSWRGNSYIDTRSASSPYQYMDSWNYTYSNTDSTFETLMGTVDSTITVEQRDETSPEGPFDPLFYQQRNFSKEVYAKGIGLIYKEFLHWTWQTTPPPAHFESDSYGIKLNLIEVR